MLRTIFDYLHQQQSTEQNLADLPNLSDFIVNYVWINEDVFTIPSHDPDAPVCGIPLHYINNAIANAKRYPTTTFQIWIDPQYLTDTPSIFLLESHIYFSGQPDNIRIRNLNDIDSYKNDPDNFFAPEQKNSIWARVDLARLLVLRHVLEETAEHANYVSLYADFDIQDVFKDNDMLRHAIAHHGFAVGGVSGADSEEYLSIENGYIAFSNYSLINFMWDICSNEKSIISPDDRDTVYGSYLVAIDSFLEMRDLDRRDVVVPEIQKPNFFQIKKPKYLDNICI